MDVRLVSYEQGYRSQKECVPGPKINGLFYHVVYEQVYKPQELCVSGSMFIDFFFLLFWWVVPPLKIFDTF